MSGIETLKEFCEERLLGEFDAETASFPAHIQEEYLTDNGWLDKEYLCRQAGVSLSTDSFRKTIKQVFGETTFIIVAVDTEIGEDEFRDLYEFGKFNNMRSWIGYTYACTGLVLARKDVYNFVLRA